MSNSDRPRVASRNRAKVVGAATLAALLAGLASAPTQGWADPAPMDREAADTAEPELSDRERAAASIDYLMKTYGVDEDEALRRLYLQADTPEIVSSVRSALGDEFMDVWLDQANGGTLTILTSKPTEAANAIPSRFPLEHIALPQSRFTGAQLRAAEAVVKERVGTVEGARVAINRREQRIDVWLPTEDRTVQGQFTARAGQRAGAGDVPVVVDFTVPRPPQPGQQKACTKVECDPPIRGGLKLTVRRNVPDSNAKDPWWGMCTAGFLLKGGGNYYLLTAGHCATGSLAKPQTGRAYMYHNGLPLVVEQNASGSFNDPAAPVDTDYVINDPHNWVVPLDYAVLPFQRTGSGASWAGYWVTNHSNRNLVLNGCVSPNPYGCTNGTMAITGVMNWANIANGFIACQSGAADTQFYNSNSGYTSGTRCGQVTGTRFLGYDGDDDALLGLIGVDICSRQGDSGSPLFSQIDKTAYGILSGGPPASGACQTGEMSYYTSLSNILAHISDPAQTGISFSLVTSSQG